MPNAHMKVAYLAAPYSHPDKAVIEARMEAFRLANNHLVQNGWVIISPLHQHFTGLTGTWEMWKTYSLSLLRIAEVMLILPLDGWEDSVGLKGEVEFAEKYMPVRVLHPETYELLPVEPK